MIQGATGFVIGVLLLQHQSALLSVHFAFLIPLLFCLLWLFPRLVFPSAFAIGFCWALYLAHAHDPGLGEEILNGRDHIAVGVVNALPDDNGSRLRFEYLVEQLEGVETKPTQPIRVRIAWYGHYPSVQVGERWRLKIRLKLPHGFRNPGGFDYEGWLYRRGIIATGYVRSWDGNSRIGERRLAYAIDRWRAHLKKKIISNLGRTEGSGLLLALTIGDRSGFGRSEWQTFSRSGTNHLVAISGLHIGIVAGLLLLGPVHVKVSKMPLYGTNERAVQNH